MKKKILLLVDYRNQFWLKSDYKEQNFDVPKLTGHFQEYGYDVEVLNFAEVDLKQGDYKDTYIVYQSSEDPELNYKSFIEDILWGIHLKGGILIPGLKYFRAHHNKVFMEILRDVSDHDGLRSLQAEYFGTVEDYEKKKAVLSKSPKVLKASGGAMSKNVSLLKTPSDFDKKPSALSRSFQFYYWMVDRIKPFLPKKYPEYKRKSHHRKKFILQDFVSGLDRDYKVLVYPGKIYATKRMVRKGDFRASGSGNFEFLTELPESLQGMLSYAMACFNQFDVPFMAMDIAHKDGKFYVIEFQFVSFGNMTLEKSKSYFTLKDGKWAWVSTASDLEEEFSRGIHEYIQKKETN